MEHKIEFLKEIEKKCYDFRSDLSMLSAKEQFDVLQNGCKHLYPEDIIIKKLEQSKKDNIPLKIKFGIDPTSTDLHLGHVVPLILLNRLQRMGHKIMFLVGDFTAMIGDPTDNYAKRIDLTRKDIENNLRDYKNQVQMFIDFKKTDILYNTNWLNELRFPEIIDILGKIDLSFSLNRTDFKKTVDESSPLTHAELIYPIIMGLDSVILEPDIEVGGEDQIPNFLMCRHIMEMKGLSPECYACTGLLEGIDASGKKMSKSLNNFIRINEKPHILFEKIMSLPNRVVPMYFMWLTELCDETVYKLEQMLKNEEIDTYILKIILAKALAVRLHNIRIMEEAYRRFIFEQYKKTSTKDVRIVLGSSMNICKFISASSSLSIDSIKMHIKNCGVVMYDETGKMIDFIIDENTDVGGIPYDRYYIKVSDKVLLRAIKQ